jgi:hypothetical protein
VAKSNASWDFHYHEGFWQPTRIPPADSNLLSAAETLARSFGKQAYNVRLFLEEIEKLDSSSPGDAAVNTTTASVRKAGPGNMEIRDKYGQFENVILSEEELKSMLSALLRRIIADFPEAGES